MRSIIKISYFPTIYAFLKDKQDQGWCRKGLKDQKNFFFNSAVEVSIS